MTRIIKMFNHFKKLFFIFGEAHFNYILINHLILFFVIAPKQGARLFKLTGNAAQQNDSVKIYMGGD